MSTLKEFNFASISSDDTLFDFDVIISKIRRTKNIDGKAFIELVRRHFDAIYPEMDADERRCAVTQYMMAALDYKKFIMTMDILGAKMTINVIV